MKIRTEIQGNPVEWDFKESDIREGFDNAIRRNPGLWELVREIAGRYQAELVRAELRKRMKSA